jgi:hypothetical protein
LLKKRTKKPLFADVRRLAGTHANSQKSFASFLQKGRPFFNPSRLAFLILPALVLLIHYPALGGYFEADDFLWVIHHSVHDAVSAITGNWGLGTAWRPITRLSFLVDAVLFGWTAWPWHAVNLALHAANAMLVACLARQAGLRRADALLTAALFAALPLDWENVDWISGRTAELCLFFLLPSTIFWLRQIRGQGGMGPACLFLALAMLCYEPAVILPLALLAAAPVLAWPASRRRLAQSLAWLAVTGLAVWALRWVLLGTLRVGTDVAAAHYLPNLGLDCLRLGDHAWRDFGPAGLLAVTAILAIGLWRQQTRRLAACSLLAAGALYLPFTPVAGFTERFLYLAGVPFAAALMASLAPLRWGRAIACLLIAAFALQAHAQAQGFRAAGDLTRKILADIKAIPDDGANLVFDQVPTHDGPYYLLWANFDDAAAALRRARGFMTTSDALLWHPALLRHALTDKTHFYVYRPATSDFAEITRADWRARHGIPLH